MIHRTPETRDYNRPFSFARDVMKLRLALVVAIALVPITTFAQTIDPIAGAWEQVSSKNLKTGQMQQLPSPHLRMICLDGYFIQFTADAARSKVDVPREKMTREQLIERLNLQGQFGTYRIAGEKVIRRVLNAAGPMNEGKETTLEFRVNGDSLMLSGTNVDGIDVEMRYTRLQTPRR